MLRDHWVNGISAPMPMLKQSRYEFFARRYVTNGGNATEAYRYAIKRLDRPPLANPNSARVLSTRLMKRPKVLARIEELRTIMAKKADITVDKILTDFQQALEMAKNRGQPNEIVTAAKAQAELVGLWKQRIETGSVADYESLESVDDVLAKVSNEMGPEAAKRLADALGLELRSNEAQTTQEPSNELLEATPPSDAVN